MLDREVLITLRRVRRDLDAFSHTLSWVGPGLGGLCAVASLVIQRELGSKAVLVCNIDSYLDGHCWVEYRRFVLDVTATQFGGPQVAVFPIKEMPVWAIPVYTSHTLFRGDAALEEISEWSPDPFRILKDFHAYHSVSQPTV